MSVEWEARNKGFISPSQLQQIRQRQRQQQQARPNQPAPSPPPPRARQAEGSGSTAFYSARDEGSTDDALSSSPPPLPGQQQPMAYPSPPQALGRPPPLGSPSRVPRSPSLLRKQNPNGSASGHSPNPSASEPRTHNPRPSVDQRRTSLSAAPAGGAAQIDARDIPVHPEVRSVVTLTHAHAQKVYFSGPLVRRVERTPDGAKPAKDDGWLDVWAQLGGTTLSVWDMRAIEEASRQGKEVPPTYVNVTDAVSTLGPAVPRNSY
jgi:CCR4-NOT transcriptional complex subunit CAF120